MQAEGFQVLPLVATNKIIHNALPGLTGTSSEALKAMCRASSVFIARVATTASKVARKAGKNIIQAADVLEAIEDMKFGKEFGKQLEQSSRDYKKWKQQQAAESKDEQPSLPEQAPKRRKVTSKLKKRVDRDVVEITLSD